MMKKFYTAIAISLCVGSFSQTALSAADASSCKQIRMASPGWADIEATNATAGFILDALGYKQIVQNVSVPITYQGLRKGQLDVFLGNWLPPQKDMVKPLIDSHEIDVLNRNLENAKFTLAVPDYVANAGVKSFADLEKYADKFDRKIYGIEPGAAGNQKIQGMLDAKDFNLNNWKLVESSEAGMLTQLRRAVKQKKWFVFLAWEPHLMNTEFKIAYLSGGDKYLGPNYGAATVDTVARHDYAKVCPNAGQFFKQLKFDVAMENQMIASVLRDKKDAKEAVVQALKQHPEKLQVWLNGVTTIDGKDGLAAVKARLAK